MLVGGAQNSTYPPLEPTANLGDMEHESGMLTHPSGMS
jgi:hypothetical protein